LQTIDNNIGYHKNLNAHAASKIFFGVEGDVLRRFEEDLDVLVKKLCEKEDEKVSKEIVRLKDHLVSLNRRNLVKINHSVMELVCAKYLILAGYTVEVEKVLNNISCDIYCFKGLGSLIIEVETGFVPPEHALDPSTYIKARIASKITRYSGYAEKFGLAVPPHYIMPIHPALIKPPRYRCKEEIKEIKASCDLYYNSPPVSFEEIENARIHAVFIIDVDSGEVKEMEPIEYVEKIRPILA